MKHDQWKDDMMGGIVAAHLSKKINVLEGGRLRASVKSDIDTERAKDDTIFRTNGAIGANKAERINGIAESFAKLNCGRDGG